MPAKRKSGKSGNRKAKRANIRNEAPPRNQDQNQTRQSYQLYSKLVAAMEIAEKAQKEQYKQNWASALSQFQKSIRMLEEILEDSKGETPFDQDSGTGDPDERRKLLRSECLHGLAISYHNMLDCATKGNMRNLLQPYREKMLEYYREYDRMRDSKESTLTLLDGYEAAVASLIRKEENDVTDPALFVEYNCSFLIVMEEACGKGWEITDEDIDRRQGICNNLFLCLTKHPETGDRAVDLLLEVSNRSSEVEDKDASYFLNSFLGSLYDQMVNQGLAWKGLRISLEELYARIAANIFDLLILEGSYDPLLDPGENLMRLYPTFQSPLSRANAASALSNYVDVLVQLDRIMEAVKATEAVLNCSMGPDGPTCTPLQWQNRLGRHVDLLLQTGQLEQAEETVKRWIKARKETLRIGYTASYQEVGISKEKYRSALEEDTAGMFVYLALIASYRKRWQEARHCLQQAKDYLQKHPRTNQARPDLARQILDLEKNGLSGDPAHS